MQGNLASLTSRPRPRTATPLILGKNDPQKDSFIFLDKEAQLDKNQIQKSESRSQK